MGPRSSSSPINVRRRGIVNRKSPGSRGDRDATSVICRMGGRGRTDGQRLRSMYRFTADHYLPFVKPATAKRNSIPRRGSTHAVLARARIHLPFQRWTSHPTEFPEGTWFPLASRGTYRACRYFSVTSLRLARDYFVALIVNLRKDGTLRGEICTLRRNAASPTAFQMNSLK